MESKAWIAISSKLKSISGNWTSYTLLGSFVLYLAGYLSLRFHMTVLGLGTDISVFDERYFFTGVNFFIYIVSSVPSLILIGVVLYFPIKILIKILRFVVLKIKPFFMKTYVFDMQFLLILGITISVIIIQVFMRQCLPLTNILVLQDVSTIKPSWLMSILIQKDFQTLYFLLLLIGLLVPMVIWWNIQSVDSKNIEFNWLKHLLSFLIVVQFLFLPINYGVLIMDKTIPRVERPKKLEDNNSKNLDFWLVWEGKTGVTYLTRDVSKNNKRTLVTLDKKEIKFQEIVCYDEIFSIILNDKKSCLKN